MFLLLFVGETCVGKSSALRCIRESYDINVVYTYTNKPLEQTDGIHIKHMSLTDFSEATDLIDVCEINGYKYAKKTSDVKDGALNVAIVENFSVSTLVTNPENIVVYIRTLESDRFTRMRYKLGWDTDRIKIQLAQDEIFCEGIKKRMTYSLDNKNSLFVFYMDCDTYMDSLKPMIQEALNKPLTQDKKSNNFLIGVVLLVPPLLALVSPLATLAVSIAVILAIAQRKTYGVFESTTYLACGFQIVAVIIGLYLGIF